MEKLKKLIRSRSKRREEGQIVILFILIFVLLGAGAIGALDYGTYIRARQKLEVAVDSAALAGALELPTSTEDAITVAGLYIAKNVPGVTLEDVTTTFYCLLGDRDEDNSPDSEDIPAVCDPGDSASWTCADGLCLSVCEPTGDNVCNTMGVAATEDVPLVFTRVLGLPPAQITASRTGACRGLCGDPHGGPVDVMLILDRTGSMDGDAMEDAIDGALAVLEIFNPEDQHVGLAVLGAGDPDNPCDLQDADHGGEWLAVPLSNDYQNADGTVNMSSQLAQTISCLDASGRTNLGSPLWDQEFGQPDAIHELLNSSRDVPMGVIFLSDGAANEPYGNDDSSEPIKSCEYADRMATIGKNHGIQIFTIGYGVEGQRCGDHERGVYDEMRVTELLARMASESADDHGHCDTTGEVDAENADGDHFLCQPKGGDLEEVFRIAANALSTSVKLVQYPVD